MQIVFPSYHYLLFVIDGSPEALLSPFANDVFFFLNKFEAVSY